MKKLLLFFLLLTLSVAAKTQSLESYYKTQENVSLTYDDNWNAIGQFSIKNISNKTINSVEVFVYFGDDKKKSHFQKTETYRTNVTIKPNERGVVRIFIGKSEEKPTQFALSRIKYSDGTICD